MARVMEVDGLSKTCRGRRRGARRALVGFDMVVPAGQVHVFLGPTGAGGTTTRRRLLGRIRGGGGGMSIFGRPVPGQLPQVVRRIGAVVESPQFFPNFSGRKTLRLLARTGGLPATRVDEVLEIVGLADRAGD